MQQIICSWVCIKWLTPVEVKKKSTLRNKYTVSSYLEETKKNKKIYHLFSEGK